MGRVKASLGHKTGNIIQSIICVIENLICVATLGNYCPGWTMYFIIWRMNTWLYDNPKAKKNEK